MEIKQDYLNKFRVNNISRERQLAKEVYEYFGKQKNSYFIIYNNIKLRGADWCRETWEVFKKADYAPKVLPYYLGMLKKAKTQWQEQQ